MKTSIYFVGTYSPIVCGIADYTGFLGHASPSGRWGVISFDPGRFGDPVMPEACSPDEPVWHGIPGRDDCSAQVIRQGLAMLDGRGNDAVLWFQHETAIWPDNHEFVDMLRELDGPKIVTFHTLHFQSDESPSGLRNSQVKLLRLVLPHVDAITVFSHGVERAVTAAFPEFRHTVTVIKHGVHLYPEVSRLDRGVARERLMDFLVHDAGLDRVTRQALQRQPALLDPDTIIIGQTGFLCPLKHSEMLYTARDELQRLIPHRNIVAMRIGGLRDDASQHYVEHLRQQQNGSDRWLLETRLTPNMLPVAQRAFDVNFYWPSDCTQSGVLAHALGAGALIAARDIEGVGETLAESGAIVDSHLPRLLLKIRDALLDPQEGARCEERALAYATRYSWWRQAQQHFRLADQVVSRSRNMPCRELSKPGFQKAGAGRPQGPLI